jgi:arginyl-tRNA synthetase
MRFYEQNAILKEGVDEKTRMSRLQLADLTAKTVKKGFEILGIQVVERL